MTQLSHTIPLTSIIFMQIRSLFIRSSPSRCLRTAFSFFNGNVHAKSYCTHTHSLRLFYMLFLPHSVPFLKFKITISDALLLLFCARLDVHVAKTLAKTFNCCCLQLRKFYVKDFSLFERARGGNLGEFMNLQ